MENFINVKTSWKHAALEYQIKQLDRAQDMTRSGLFKRAVLLAEPVKDWMPVYASLCGLKFEKDAPEFTNWQARYDDETSHRLAQIKEDAQGSLKAGGIIKRTIQTQFLLQLLMLNYLEYLRRMRISLADGKVGEGTIDLPTMSSIFTEMMLTDRGCNALKEIQKILIIWRNAR